MNTKIKMRLLSLLLCFVMLFGLMPTSVFAWTAPTLSGNGGDAWNVQLSDEGVLTWNDMGSATYDISVDNTPMGGTVTNIYSINTNAYNLINRFRELKLENGNYYFYIKANDTDTTSGQIHFRYVSPEAKLSEPQNLRWDGTVAKWDSVANATEYEVYLYSNSGYCQRTRTTTETQYDWSTNVYNDGWWFEVVATGDNYRNSNAAEGPKYGSYSWTAPTLSGGKAAWNVQLSDEGVLTWNDMGSATYDIYVDNTGYVISNSASYTINGTPNDTTFNTAEQRGMNFVATAPAVTTYTVTGSVTSFGSETDEVMIQLTESGAAEPAYEAVVKGNTAAYSIEDVAPGTYTMKVMKKNHVTREYTVTVGSSNVVQDVTIHLFGDINGDGVINAQDALLVLKAAVDKHTPTAQEQQAGDVNADGTLDASDALLILKKCGQ